MLSEKLWKQIHRMLLENTKDVFPDRATLGSARTDTYCDIVSMLLVSLGPLEYLPIFPTQ